MSTAGKGAPSESGSRRERPNAGGSRLGRQRDLLRFTTAGNVDDGKSTLIGRLLYDSRKLFRDQMQQLEYIMKLRGEERVNLAQLTDGLRAEREQGITIDVAYRYFSTARRKFILADAPGHEQYTRNMVTGASTADVAVILIDASNGLLPQTRRHGIIASLLGIRHVAVCVNKMDLDDFRLPVQYVIRPRDEHRAYAGKVAGGTIRSGEEIVVLPSRRSSRVKSIYRNLEHREHASVGDSIVLTLEDELDVSRGDMIVGRNDTPEVSAEVEAVLCWMDDANDLDPAAALRSVRPESRHRRLYPYRPRRQSHRCRRHDSSLKA